MSKSRKPKHRLDQPAKEDQELDFRDIRKHLDRESAHFVVRLETHSGKPVTTVEPHRRIRDSIELPRLAHRLKDRLGTGGEVEEGRIILHGDHRERAGNELVNLGAEAENIEII